MRKNVNGYNVVIIVAIRLKSFDIRCVSVVDSESCHSLLLLPSESIIFGNDSWSIDSVSTKESVNQNRLTS